MKVTGIVGSPRADGATNALVCKVLEGAREAGAETVLFNIQEAGVGGCMACYACKDTGVCRQDDGMTPIYEAIRSSGAIVIGTPIYMFTVSGQTKTFIDRLFPFLKSDFTSRLGEGLPSVMVYAQGAPKAGIFANTFDSVEKALGMLGFNTRKRIVATGASGDISDQTALMDEAREAGKGLASKTC